MFRLTNRLALSNLIKIVSFIVSFCFVTILAIVITFISLLSLTINPHLDDLTGAGAIKMVLGWDLELSLYPLELSFFMPCFVMKNRSRGLGLYSVLGLEKRHPLFSMILRNSDYEFVRACF